MNDRIVIVYERVSTDQQDISRQAVQRERARADYPDAEVRVIQDDGVSAFKVSVFDRPGGRALCGLVSAGSVEAVYVDAQDRLSRGADDEWVAFRALCDGSDTWIVVDGQRITRDMGGRVLSYLRAELARQESVEKSHRVKSGMARAASQGRANGGPRRFGFSQEDGRLVPRQDEIAVVERMMREAIAGRSQTEIAAGLNADGYRTSRGSRWNQPRIGQVLRDRIWTGVLVNMAGEHRIAEPFVPMELWEAVQATLRGPDGPRVGQKTKRFLLGNGLLRCGQCGSAMIVRRDQKDYGWYEVYLCGGRSNGATDCTQGAVHRAAVDGAVLAYFERVGLDIETTRAELNARADRERSEVRVLRGQAERELAKATERFDRVKRAFQDGIIEADDWAEQRAQLQDELNAAQQNVERLTAREAEVTEDAVGVVEDVELLTRLTELRSAIAGNVAANPDDFAATHAALGRLFHGFVLRRDAMSLPTSAVVDVDGEEVLLHDVPTVSGYVLEPVPRSDAVVFNGMGGIVPVPLGLKAPANGPGGINGTAR